MDATLKSRYGQPLTVAQIVAGGFSTPWDAPLVPPFPFSFRNVEVLTLVWRTAVERVDALLPPGLSRGSDVVMAHLYKMHDPDWLGPYSECNVMVGVRHDASGERGSYSPYLFLSSDTGVAHGREVHGQPKKLARPSLVAEGDAWVGRVERNGIDVITGTLPYKQEPAELARMAAHYDFALNINLKAIDHIDGRPAIRQLTARRLAQLTVHECWSGPCTVELRPNIQAPLHRLPVLEMLDGFYWRADFTLDRGRVLHDYLAESAAAAAGPGPAPGCPAG